MAPSDRRSARCSCRCIPLADDPRYLWRHHRYSSYAILAVSLIAVTLEIKDVQGGGKFDWTDLAVTIIGAILILIPICFSVTSNLDMVIFKML